MKKILFILIGLFLTTNAYGVFFPGFTPTHAICDGKEYKIGDPALQKCREQVKAREEQKRIQESVSGKVRCIVYSENIVAIEYDFRNGSNVSLFRDNTRISVLGSGITTDIYYDKNLSPEITYTYYLRNGSSPNDVEIASVKCKPKNSMFTRIYLETLKAIEDRERDEMAKKDAESIIKRKEHDKRVESILKEMGYSDPVEDLEKILKENIELRIENEQLREQNSIFKNTINRLMALIDKQNYIISLVEKLFPNLK